MTALHMTATMKRTTMAIIRHVIITITNDVAAIIIHHATIIMGVDTAAHVAKEVLDYEN